MRRLYLITYDDKLKRSELTSFFDDETETDFGQWFFSMPNSLFVYSSLSADEVYRRIKEKFPGHGRFFVTAVPYHNSQGLMPNNHWEIVNANSAVHDYSLDFRGYWLEGKESSLPAESGIYCVYSAVYNQAVDTVTLRELLYVGKSVNVRKRHEDHEGKPCWKRKLNNGEILSYSFAPLAVGSLAICESALIYKQQPKCNDMGKEAFLHETTHIVTGGSNAFLPKEFTVAHS